MKGPRSWTQWARRFTQTGVLLAFLWVVLATAFTADYQARIGLTLFFLLDPLVAFATLLAGHVWVAGAALALVTVAMTLVFGRVFCGWFCPLGTVHNAAGAFRRPAAPGAAPQRYSPWQRLKYVVLLALLTGAVFGLHVIGLLDPLSLLYRSTATAVLPAAQYAVDDASTAIYQADPKLGPLRMTDATEPAYRFLRDKVFVLKRQSFAGAAAIGLVFVGILALNRVRPRFWCRYVCPLGGLLGLLSVRPMMRLHNDESQCNNCGKCNRACPAAAQPDVRGGWLPTECFGCWNCVAACNFGAIRFTFAPWWRKPNAGGLDVGRRDVLAAGVGGVAALLAFRLNPAAQARAIPPRLIRPPGALPERDFLQRCIQCGLCMRVCPTNALHPAGVDGGIESLWTPKLVPKLGYCEYDCTLCGQVCPTGAIEELTREAKQQTKIGLARFDMGRCLPYAYGRDCAVCEEHCPVPDKAIYFVDVEVTMRDGATKTVHQPRIDVDKCIGCGVCEWACVFRDRAAIRVTRAHESRDPDNQPILPAADDTNPYGF